MIQEFIVQYDVERDDVLEDLIQAVNNKLEDGWKLAGGICCDSRQFYQAVFKKSLAPKEDRK